MTVYALHNGLSIDLTFKTPDFFNPRGAFPKFKRGDLYGSSLDAYPFPIDQNGNPIPQTNVMKMSASGILSGASPEMFAKCSLRFIQVIKVRSFEVSYFGKRPDEGSVNWIWQGQLLQQNIDCWVSEDGAQDSAPFQFIALAVAKHVAPNKLECTLGDTPGAEIPLAEYNREAKHDNYLRSFVDRRNFESIITFVHPDNSMQMLESWGWRFTRNVALKWTKLAPEVDGANHILFTKDANATPVFGRDAEYAATLTSGRIANRLTRAAMRNVRGDPNVSYVAVEEANLFPPDRFWQP